MFLGFTEPCSFCTYLLKVPAIVVVSQHMCAKRLWSTEGSLLFSWRNMLESNLTNIWTVKFAPIHSQSSNICATIFKTYQFRPKHFINQLNRWVMPQRIRNVHTVRKERSSTCPSKSWGTWDTKLGVDMRRVSWQHVLSATKSSKGMNWPWSGQLIKIFGS